MAHYSQGWQYRATVEVTPPSISAALSGYVALVRLNAENFDFSLALETGHDIRFGLPEGTEFLPFERVMWDAENEIGLFYVRIPEIPVAGTTLYVYAGNPEATDASSGANTWADYAAVVHMIRDGDGKIRESKTGYELTLVGGVAYPTSVDGHNHKAEFFDGDSEAGYWVMPATMLPNFGSTFEQDLSLEVVLRATATTSVDRPIVSQGNYTNSTYSLYLELNGLDVWMNDGPYASLGTNIWALITGSRDLPNDIRSLYVNENNSSTDEGYTYTPQDASTYIGGNDAVTTSGSERAFKGEIEEVRFVYSARSEDWHKVTKADLIDGTLLTIGLLNLNPDGGYPHYSADWAYRLQLEITSETGHEGPCVCVIDLVRDWGVYVRSLPDGRDVRFALPDGIGFLPYERQVWQTSPYGEFTFAVRLPSLPAGKTLLNIYTGNWFAEDVSDHDATWAGDVVEVPISIGTPTRWILIGTNPYARHPDHFSRGFRFRAPINVTPPEGTTETLYNVLVKIPVYDTDAVVSTYGWDLAKWFFSFFRFGDPEGEDWYPSVPGDMDTCYTTSCPNQDFYVVLPELPPEGTLVWMYWFVNTYDVWRVLGHQQEHPEVVNPLNVEVSFYPRQDNPDNANPLPSSSQEGPSVPTPSPGETLPDEIPEPPSVTQTEPSTILSASVSLEDYGIANLILESTVAYNVGEYVEIKNPVTDNRVFRGMVTKCSYDYRTRTYSIQGQDPMSALSQGEVIWNSPEATPVFEVLMQVLGDFGQVLGGERGQEGNLAPVACLADPEVEVPPLSWLELVRTFCRISGKRLAYGPNCTYVAGAETDHGILMSNQMLNAATSALTDRYANRVIVKCSGEWWSEPGTETQDVEWIRGAYMIVRRRGEQIQEITLSGSYPHETFGFTHHEVFTYDESNRLISHVVTTITTMVNGNQYKTEITREWDITDEVNYSYSEEVITECQWYWDPGNWWNKQKKVITTTVADGSVIEVSTGYLWNYGLSVWEPLTTVDSMIVTRGFPAQPGINGYGVKETYRCDYNSEQEDWVYTQIRSEVISSAPTAPGYSVILPLSHETVNYCVTAEDAAAQVALGLKETVYSPVCVQDDASLTTLTTIAENELIWRCRCRQLQGTVALAVGETWQPGDTFTWGGLTWTIERLDHDLVGRTTGITATAEASIEALKKALLPEYTDDGLAIVGVARKIAERYDQVTPATVVSQVDYETYVVQLPSGKKKLAKLEYGSATMLAPGSSIMLMRGAIQ